MTTISGTTIERFGSDELSEAEETEVLLDCEQSPSQWRHLVLAVLEHRALSRCFRSEADRTGSSAWGATAAVSRSGASLRDPQMASWVAAALVAGLCFGFSWASLRRPALSETLDRQTRHVDTVKERVTDRFVSTKDLDPDVAYRKLLEVAAAEPSMSPEDRRDLEESGITLEEQPVLFVWSMGDGGAYAISGRNTLLRLRGREVTEKSHPENES